MADEITATPEGTASPSPTDVGATGASGVDATGGQPPTDPSTQEQTATETPTDEFSAGWNLDDQADEQSGIPENDDDIPKLTEDPNLDKERVPGLVEHLRSARAEARQSSKEAKRLAGELAKLEEYGGMEGIGRTMGIVNGLIHNPTTGALPFLQALSTQATPAYWQLFDNFVKYEADNLVEALREAGKLPDAQAQTASEELTAEDWARIPQELREIAKQVPVNQLIEWLDKGTDESLAFNLNTHKELSELKGAQREQAEEKWRTAVQQAEHQAERAIDDLSDRYQKAHYAQLAKWQPFGPQSAKENQRLHRMVVESAFAEILEDQQWNELYHDTLGKLKGAPLRRLKNEHMAADADERSARENAARFNTRLGQIMKDMIKHPIHGLDSVFRDARQWREHQRQTAPDLDRKEISGINNTATNGASPGESALDENFNIKDDFINRLAGRMKGWTGGVR